jgi:hypothetical protein
MFFIMAVFLRPMSQFFSPGCMIPFPVKINVHPNCFRKEIRSRPCFMGVNNSVPGRSIREKDPDAIREKDFLNG